MISNKVRLFRLTVAVCLNVPIDSWTGRLPWHVIKTCPSKANSLATTSDILSDSLFASHEGKTDLNNRKARIWWFRKQNLQLYTCHDYMVSKLRNKNLH